MKIKTLTVEQQRDRATGMAMVSLGLEAHLRNLSSAVLAGDLTKVVEFQQSMQYAPVEIRQRIDDFIQESPCHD